MNAFFNSIGDKLNQIFNPEVLADKFAAWLNSLIVVLLILLVFYIIWRVINLLLKPALMRANTDETTVVFVQTLVKYSFLVIGFITALGSAGIQITAVLASLGIVGLTIGFAAKDALSNIISGILIYLDRPFVIGDLVEIEDKYGKVQRITLRSTRVVTVDGRMLAIPNTEIINKTAVSYTNFPNLRLDIPVTVAVTEDLNKVRSILLGIVEDNPNYLTDPPPQMVVTQLNDYNVAVELQVWLKNEREHVAERYKLREKIFNVLTSEGVEMPYETLQLAPFEAAVAQSGN